IVDAHLGRIVKVIPVSGPRYAMPLMRPPYGRPPRPMAMVPGDEFDDFTPAGPGMAALPGGAPRTSSSQGSAAQIGPPVPPPRAAAAAAAQSSGVRPASDRRGAASGPVRLRMSYPK